MAAAELSTVEKAQLLSDIELATLLCLVTSEHCLIDASKEAIDDVAKEISWACGQVFGLSHVVIDCDNHTTVEDFGDGLLVDQDVSYSRRRHKSLSNDKPLFESVKGKSRESTKTSGFLSPVETRGIANIIIAKNLDLTDDYVQTQALELIRGRRIFTRTAVFTAPKDFVFVILNASGSQKRLKVHLIDHLILCHHHYDGDALPNLEDQAEVDEMKSTSISNPNLLRPASKPSRMFKKSSLFMTEEIETLTKRMVNVQITAEIRAYMHHIVVFLRQHRAVDGGVTALATRQISVLSKALAVLHGLDYITPSLVSLAVRKIYTHRIVITRPEHERSLQWGSSLEAVKEVLQGLTVDDIIEEVLEAVETPL